MFLRVVNSHIQLLIIAYSDHSQYIPVCSQFNPREGMVTAIEMGLSLPQLFALESF